MRMTEYMLSLLLALTMLAGLVVWTQATERDAVNALSCQSRRTASPVIIRGTNIYLGCQVRPLS